MILRVDAVPVGAPELLNSTENTASALATQAAARAISDYHRTVTSEVISRKIFPWTRTQFLHLPQPAPYARNTMTEPTVTISNLSLAELKTLVEGLVDDRLRTLLGDPDLGAPLGESVRERLKQSLASTARISGDEVADTLGLRW